jgi:hypothetical protein
VLATLSRWRPRVRVPYEPLSPCGPKDKARDYGSRDAGSIPARGTEAGAKWSSTLVVNQVSQRVRVPPVSCHISRHPGWAGPRFQPWRGGFDSYMPCFRSMQVVGQPLIRAGGWFDSNWSDSPPRSGNATRLLSAAPMVRVHPRGLRVGGHGDLAGLISRRGRSSRHPLPPRWGNGQPAWFSTR